jgi:hypothetical protein
MARAVQILPRKTKTMGAFSRMHKRNSIKQRQISMSNLQNGFIIKMDYFGKWTRRFKTSHYLVIEPSHNDYIHVFDIDFVPASALKYIVNLTQDKKPGQFIFANQTFSFLNFKQSKKPLYRLLYPIMKRSYRRLIRSKTNVKRTFLIDYNFSSMRQFETPKFVTPSIEKEILQIKNAAAELSLDETRVMSLSKSGIIRTLTPAIWSNIRNTNSWNLKLTQKMAKELASSRGKSDFEIERIFDAMKANHTFEAPILMKYGKNDYHCIAGEVRLLAAMSLRVTPKVYIFTYQ